MIEESLNNRPLLSVIIPCYNVEKYLNRCLESVINQTYDNLEIILVDDGSPDKSGLLCDEWATKDNRIKVIHKQNGGLGFARNSGIEIATGDYIAFVDSDDYINLTMYDRLISVAINNNAEIVYCGHIKEVQDGNYVKVFDFNSEKIFEKESLIELSQGFFKPTVFNPHMLTMSVWHAVYNRSVITQLFYSEREVGSEDIHFQICAMLNSKRVVFIPDTLYVYCYNGESLSHTFDIKKFDRYKRLNEIINETYKRYAVDSPANYIVFMMAFSIIRLISLSKNSLKEKRKQIAQIIYDPFWETHQIDATKFDVTKKVFYKFLLAQSIIPIMAMSQLYCFINYKIKKKSIH